jgi:formate-dependent nitrite reductase membrane component NrfD
MEPGLLKSADWPLLIDLYFFLGGLAGGAFVIATIAGFVDGRRYRDVVRIGYYVSFLAVLPCPILLIVDLGVPSRFLNMLMAAKASEAFGMSAISAGPFHLKPYSPMSAGAWGLMVFSACAFVCAAETWLADRRGQPYPRIRMVAGAVGAASGFFLAAYPGVLLGATTRPLFINAHWLGALFLAVGAATGGAAIALVLERRGNGGNGGDGGNGFTNGGTEERRRTETILRSSHLRGPAPGRAEFRESVSAVMRVVSVALVLELVALVMLVVSVKSAGSVGIDTALTQLLTGAYSLPFWLGAVFMGAIVPLWLGRRRAWRPAFAGATFQAVLVLAGGFLVKFVILAAGQAPLPGVAG